MLKPKYKLLIFDLDGTVLDTLCDLTSSMNFALHTMEYPERSIEEIRSFVGNGVRNLAKRALPEEASERLVDEALSIFKKHYAEHINDFTKPYDGIKELLSYAKKAGCYLAVISNKIDSATNILVKSHFGDIFDVVFGEREGVPRKPSPQSVFEVIEALSCKPCETTYIGDSEIDIQTANNAGIDCISVCWGFKSRDFLEENGASLIAESADELLDALFTRN